MKSPTIGSLVGSLSVFAVFCATAIADEIRMLKGRDLLDVTVVEETMNEVKFRIKGIAQLQNRPASQVKEVVYSQFSDRYLQGQEAMDKKQYDKAVQCFLAAAGNTPRKFEWEVQYSLFKAAECLRLAKNYDEANKAYDQLLARVPATRFYGRAYERKAMCYESKNDLAKATETFLSLKKSAATAGVRHGFLADYHLIRLNQKADPDGALDRFKELRVKADEEGLGDIANLARLGVGNVLIGQGKIDEARSSFEEIIENRQISDTVVVAGAYLGLGNTYVAKKTPSSEDLDAALTPFLRVVFMYGTELGSDPTVAEALYWAGRCFESRESIDEKARQRKVFLYQWVVRDYPGSSWAQQAQARL